MRSLAGEALSSHEAWSRRGATTKSTSHVKSALELGRQLTENGQVDPVVFEMAMTRIAAPAVEAKAGKEVRVPRILPGARSNQAVSEDPL